jgi:hypothetical protein
MDGPHPGDIEDPFQLQTHITPRTAPAPAIKLLSSHRLILLSALTQPKFLSTLSPLFKTLSDDLASKGIQGTTPAKLSRHWREVLSADVRRHISSSGGGSGGGGASDLKVKVKGGGGTGTIGKIERQGIWKVVLKHQDKLDWGWVESESGEVGRARMKRHLRDVLAKEVEKMIKG